MRTLETINERAEELLNETKKHCYGVELFNSLLDYKYESKINEVIYHRNEDLIYIYLKDFYKINITKKMAYINKIGGVDYHQEINIDKDFFKGVVDLLEIERALFQEFSIITNKAIEYKDITDYTITLKNF